MCSVALPRLLENGVCFVPTIAGTNRAVHGLGCMQTGCNGTMFDRCAICNVPGSRIMMYSVQATIIQIYRVNNVTSVYTPTGKTHMSQQKQQLLCSNCSLLGGTCSCSPCCMKLTVALCTRALLGSLPLWHYILVHGHHCDGLSARVGLEDHNTLLQCKQGKVLASPHTLTSVHLWWCTKQRWSRESACWSNKMRFAAAESPLLATPVTLLPN